MKTQLIKGHAELRKLTAESVEKAVASSKTELKEATEVRQHFVESLVDAMNGITFLRNKYED